MYVVIQDEHVYERQRNEYTHMSMCIHNKWQSRQLFTIV